MRMQLKKTFHAFGHSPVNDAHAMGPAQAIQRVQALTTKIIDNMKHNNLKHNNLYRRGEWSIPLFSFFKYTQKFYSSLIFYMR